MTNASTGLDTESARAFVNDVTDAYIDGGGGTHWHGCHRAHPRCAALMGARNMALLLAEVERLHDVRRALETLVGLKDGPRDENYYAAKPEAWSMARAALTALDDRENHDD